MITKTKNSPLKFGPIGIFDSGVGGLTILKEIKKTLPEYDYIYLGDNARAPYGTRSFETVYEYTLEAVKKLFSLGCPLIIIACNTASAKALRSIQQNDLPKIAPEKRVLGVIRPTTEEIGHFTQTKHVGILATPGTVKSDSYRIEIEKFFPDLRVHQEACPMWVPLIENNEHNTPGGEYFIQKNLNHLLQKDHRIDTIILGCTHYPLLIPQLKKLIPPSIRIISQGPIVAEKLKIYLHRHPEIALQCTTGGTVKYLTTESSFDFEEKARLFLNEPIRAEHTDMR
ncbi:MAG: glutamate racemase [Flavobacteriales bacterium]|nr:glutamate racemase [Flavobacteriales bacterium]